MEAFGSLGIDYRSILLYTVNFGILFFILGKYLYKPLINILDQRQKIIESSINEAENLKSEFQKKLHQIESEKEQAHHKLQEEMSKLKKYTEEKRAEMIKEMELQKAQLLEHASAEIEAKKKQILKDAEKQTLELIKKVVLYVVHHKVPEKVIEESITEAWQKEAKV